MSCGVVAFTGFNSVLMKGGNHCAVHALMTRLSALLHLNIFLSSLNHSYLLLHRKSRRRCNFTVAVNDIDDESQKVHGHQVYVILVRKSVKCT